MSTLALALLTLVEAAPILGITTGSARSIRVRTLRKLRQLETERGARLLIAVGGEGHGARFRVSLAALRDHLPERFSRNDAAVGALRAAFAAFREELEERADRVDLLADALGGLRGRTDGVERRMSTSRT